jgi:hypothetical protein
VFRCPIENIFAYLKEMKTFSYDFFYIFYRFIFTYIYNPYEINLLLFLDSAGDETQGLARGKHLLYF